MLRVIDHLRSLGMTSREARQALQTGKVYLRDAPTADPSREIDGERVSVRMTAPRARVGVDPVITFRDEHLAVVVKPSGMLSVPAPRRRDEPTVIGQVSKAIGGVLAVHRLDEGTSGLMLVARTEACQTALKDLFFHHDVVREYLALVRGRFPDGDTTTVRDVLVRDRGDGRRGVGRESDPDGKRAITHLRLVERAGRDNSLIEARLETGRTHQVRIHLAELGHPVLGDRLYGERYVRAAPRLALHARTLSFRHPITGKAHTFEAPLADDLERLLRDLVRAGHRRRR